MIIAFTIIIFLQIITYIIIADVLLSWLTIFWLNFRPIFISSVLDPIYNWVKKYIPTTIWPLDLTPIIVIIFIWFLRWIVLGFFPETASYMNMLK